MPASAAPRPFPNWLVGLMIFGLFLTFLLCIYFLYRLIPHQGGPIKICPGSLIGFSSNCEPATWCPCFLLNPASEGRMFLLMVLGGVLGALVHSATSFTAFLGAGRLYLSWLGWYLLRPFIGASLAVITYFLLRGGLFSAGTGPQDINVYGMLALAALAGMFSKKATDWLKDIFDTIFKTKENPAYRFDTLNEDIQTVTKVMIPKSEIVDFTLPENQSPQALPLQQLVDFLNSTGKNRLVMLNADGKALHLVHKSVLEHFQLEQAKKMAANKNEDVATGLDKLTFGQFLENAGGENAFGPNNGFVTVSQAATLEEANAAMLQMQGCRDVLITETGDPNEPVKGWLTNVLISQNLN